MNQQLLNQILNNNNFLKNPASFIAGYGLNIPSQLRGDPKQAVQYFLDNGIVSQEAYNKAIQIGKQMGLSL